MGPLVLEPPRRLPVDHLSVSSIRLFMQCSEKWRRRYLEREYEPANGKMLIGSAAGAAESHSFQAQIDTGAGLPLDDVLDLYADEWTERTGREEIVWGDDKPDDLRSSGQAALTAYHSTVAPQVRPVSVERQFTLDFEGVDWSFTGFLDLEEEDLSVGDLKFRGARMSPQDAAADSQASAYLLARRSEGQPASEFRFHTAVRVKKPYAEIVPTTRTDQQLDWFTQRVYNVAAEMAWRTEYDCWDGAPPGAWWCSQRSCGFWGSCVYGGCRDE